MGKYIAIGKEGGRLVFVKFTARTVDEAYRKAEELVYSHFAVLVATESEFNRALKNLKKQKEVY